MDALRTFVFSIVLMTGSASKADDYSILQTECQNVRSPETKERKCLALISTGRLSKKVIPQAYAEVAHTLFQRERYAEATRFIEIEIGIAADVVKAELKSDSLSEFGRYALAAQMSYRYWRLGMMQGLTRLALTNDKSEEGRKLASAQAFSYSRSISLNSKNHAALIGRSEANGLLCRAELAEVDRQSAVKAARAAGDEKAVREYQIKVPPACVPEWRNKD